MKLISMTEFVLEQLNEKNSRVKPIRDVLNSIENYAKFLKQPLKLEMFVPCDVDGKVMEEPMPEHYTDCNYKQNLLDYQYNLERFNKAKKKVIFKDFNIIKEYKYYYIGLNKNNIWITLNDEKTIEEVLVPLKIECKFEF